MLVPLHKGRFLQPKGMREEVIMREEEEEEEGRIVKE